MNTISRRDFIKASSLVVAGTALSSTSYGFTKGVSPLSFSTLGCPKWTLNEVIDFAAGNGYQGIEIRGILGEVDLTKCPDFSSKERIVSSRKIAEDKGIKIINLGSSAELHHPAGEKRQSNLDGAKKFIDLAQQLNCPYMRVFPNRFPKDQDHVATIDLISKGLLELAEYAKGSTVSVLLETHGDIVLTSDLLQIMKNSEHAQIGLIWDIFNMWSVTKESPTSVYESLKKYIRHTHFKDAKEVDGKMHYVLLGQGEGPISEAVSALRKGNYAGYYSFEWEKLWHPEIEEPEIALAHYPDQIKKYFKG